MENLKFKKIGWFSEAVSARYEAKVNENCIVSIEAVISEGYGKSWLIWFKGTDERFLNENPYIDPECTKREAVETANNLVQNKKQKQ